ncbi:DUF2470 domain-containing protein [Skermania sp. ID1734]|uniref:DUF2470 domain-containing protein n=1 Tax=Skermania sp. ID1734 TaxID=2597516 RepID=UPI00117F676B|nr:DUF2470 domain-containing protein [Skermania sp. ID1734]TSE00791.1 DUF2470 domain-containing protein [Skermania sp. ID1734]
MPALAKQQRPTTEERVRTAILRARDARLAVPGQDPEPTVVHHLRAGDVVVGIPTASLNFMPGTAAVLELTDQTPLNLREPVRSLVWLRGELFPLGSAERSVAADIAVENPDPALLDVGRSVTLLRLMLDSAVVADSTGAESVTPAKLFAATPDPFWECETAWLQHLDSDHADVIELLARRLPPQLRGGSVRPLAIDRFGLTLRVEKYGEDFMSDDRDIRLPFNEPVTDGEGLSRAIRILVGCPFLNGMRRG